MKLLLVVTCPFPGDWPGCLLDRWQVKGLGFVLVTTLPFDKFFSAFMVGTIKSFYEPPISHVPALETVRHLTAQFHANIRTKVITCLIPLDARLIGAL